VCAQPIAPVDVGGKERVKYFKRPLVPFLHAVTMVRPQGSIAVRHHRTTPHHTALYCTALPFSPLLTHCSLSYSCAQPIPVAIGGDPAQSMVADAVLQQAGGQPGAAGAAAGVAVADAAAAAAAAAAPAAVRPTSAADATVDVGGTRTVGTQSLYRESEAQTDPYTPDIATVPGEPEPEELSIAHLSWGRGLPASAEEVSMILRAREKRAFEASLPAISDEASFELRKRMLEERELKEWALRGEEMKRELEQRLQIMIDTLKQREAEKDRMIEHRIDALRQVKTDARTQIYQQIHKDSVKMQRNILKNGRFLEHKSHARDIVSEHADFGSKLYAPITREGRLPVKNAVVDYGIPLISNYAGITSLEQNLPKSVTQISVKTYAIARASPHMHETVYRTI
jgi:hypothetical protein